MVTAAVAVPIVVGLILLAISRRGGSEDAGPETAGGPVAPVTATPPVPSVPEQTPVELSVFDAAHREAVAGSPSREDPIAYCLHWEPFVERWRTERGQREQRAVQEIQNELASIRRRAIDEAFRETESARREVEDFVAQLKVSEARTALEGIHPRYDPEGRVAAAIERLRGEIEEVEPYAETIARARAHVEAGEVEDAVRLLGEIPDEAPAQVHRFAEEMARGLAGAGAIALIRAERRRRREQAEGRIAELGRALEREAELRLERVRRTAEELVRISQTRKLDGGGLGPHGRIRSEAPFDGAQFFVDFTNTRNKRYRLRALPPVLRATFIPVFAEGADPVLLFQEGREAMQRSEFDLAVPWIARAVEREPALAPFRPDAVLAQRGRRSITGTVTSEGNVVRLTYRFDDPAEAQDFEGGSARVEGGALILDGSSGVAEASVRGFPMRPPLSIRLEAQAPEPGTWIGIGLTHEDLTASLIAFWASSREGVEFCALWRTNRGVGRQEGEAWQGRPVSISAEATGLAVVVDGPDGRKTLRASYPMTGDWFLALAAQGVARFEGAEVSATPHPEWIRKLSCERQVILATELARSELPPGWTPGHEGGPASAARSLSSTPYEAGRSRLEAEVREKVEAGWRALEAARSAQTAVEWLRSLERARDEFRAAAGRMPAWAESWRGKAVAERWLGNPTQAIADLRRALGEDPDFAEAHAELADLLLDQGTAESRQEALEHLGRAIESSPDSATAHFARARFQYEEGRMEEALETCHLVRALAAGDNDLLRRNRRLLGAIEGPPWDEEAQWLRESPCYRTSTDVSDEAAARYDGHLKAIRAYYAELLGDVPAPARPTRVYIFNTAEGYYSFLGLSYEDRLENTLGIFMPEFRQLLLFDDPDWDETARVLQHEGFHDYLHLVIPLAPPWLNEGMAEYAAAAVIREGRVASTGAILTGRRESLRGMQPVAWRDIMGFGYGTFQGPVGPYLYAQAWSMVHFLMEADGGRHRDVLRELIRRLREGEDYAAAVAEVFPDEVLGPLERDWQQWVTRLP